MQLKGIGQETARKLSSAGISDLKHLVKRALCLLHMQVSQKMTVLALLDLRPGQVEPQHD